ncbi:hypothetical protein D3C76_846410 [compost metagenome]
MNFSKASFPRLPCIFESLYCEVVDVFIMASVSLEEFKTFMIEGKAAKLTKSSSLNNKMNSPLAISHTLQQLMANPIFSSKAKYFNLASLMLWISS